MEDTLADVILIAQQTNAQERDRKRRARGRNVSEPEEISGLKGRGQTCCETTPSASTPRRSTGRPISTIYMGSCTVPTGTFVLVFVGLVVFTPWTHFGWMS